jgi:hypothetical protein
MTQTQAILQEFKEGKTLNILTAFQLTGSMKLSTRVNDTYEKMGYVFTKKMVHFKTKYKTSGRYMEYTLDLENTPKQLLETDGDIIH